MLIHVVTNDADLCKAILTGDLSTFAINKNFNDAIQMIDQGIGSGIFYDLRLGRLHEMQIIKILHHVGATLVVYEPEQNLERQLNYVSRKIQYHHGLVHPGVIIYSMADEKSIGRVMNHRKSTWPSWFDIHRDNAILTLSGVEIELTVTEAGIIALLAELPESLKSRDQIMDYAYRNSVVVDRTIDSHIKRIRIKIARTMGSDDWKDLIVTRYGLGYMLSFKEVSKLITVEAAE